MFFWRIHGFFFPNLGDKYPEIAKNSEPPDRSFTCCKLSDRVPDTVGMKKLLFHLKPWEENIYESIFISLLLSYLALGKTHIKKSVFFSGRTTKDLTPLH